MTFITAIKGGDDVTFLSVYLVVCKMTQNVLNVFKRKLRKHQGTDNEITVMFWVPRGL